MKHSKNSIYLLLFAALFLAACNSDNQRDSGGDSVIFTDIAPTAFFVKRICGSHFEVDILVKAGQDPHTFAPTPKQVISLNKSRAFLHADMPFSRTIVSKLGEGPKIVNVTANLERMKAKHKCASCEHEKEDDPHIWMSPRLMLGVCNTICDKLCEMDGENSAEYKANCQKLIEELTELDNEITTMLKPVAGSSFFIYHPSLGYLARDYNLKQVAVETGGGAPGPKHVNNLIESAIAEKIKAIFVQATFPDTAAKTIADKTGAAVVTLDPLSEDYIVNMKKIAAELSKALSGNDGTAE